MTSRAPFDLTAALPLGRTVIEASAGTGKTYSLTALIVRYIAEAGVAVDQFLVVTFTRAAANDLRDRTRDVLLRALHAVTTNTVPDGHPWMSVLLASPESPAEQSSRLQRLAGAVNHFDELTITTIHGYCQQALVQLGVRAAIDPDAMLVENTHDIVAEVCRDIIVTELADQPSLLNSPRGSERKVTTPAQAEAQLIANVTTLLTNPGVVHAPPSSFDSSGRLIVGDGQPTAMDEMAARWIQLTRSAFEQVSARQILRNEIGYDSLISGVRDALADPRTGHAIAAQLAQRSTVVLVDEFQDTDRVQWDVFQRAFASKTLITVGDPKQAIYRFRGADVHAYLDAVDRQSVLTLDTNHRSDRRVLAGLERLLDGASLGDPRIRFAPVRARSSAPDSALGDRSPTIGPTSRTSAAIQLRVAPLDPALRAGQQRDLSMPLVRTLVLADLTRRIIDLLDNGFISPGDGDVDGHDNAVRPGDIAVLVPSHAEANNVAEALRRAGIPAVRTRTGSVMQTPAAGQWRLLLAALAQPHDAPVVRAAALGWFLPTDIRSLAGSDDVLVALHEHVARMAAARRLPDSVCCERLLIENLYTDFILQCLCLHPKRRQQLCLCQHRLGRFLLQIRWKAMFFEDALHHNLNSGTCTFADSPVYGYAFANLGYQFSGNDF